MTKLVECSNVSKRYGTKLALDHINLTIERGKIIGLLGPNGSGKTTLIKLLNDLLSPDQGTILINGNQPGIESKKIISYLPERTYLNFNMKIKELITYFQDFYEDFDCNKAYELLEKLGINSNDKLKTMSKGTKEKVQLIMVMSRKADLYILDEPIGGVDPAARDYILDTILNNFNDHASIIISTHLIADIERVLDEVIFVKQGKIMLQKSTDSIRKESGQSIDGYFREAFKC
ncbi:MAG: ABC transporter ATP-binding protein [Bacilli bacterium]|jgi:ABC-2 type transport system ATP-binding protein|nr:ABC transporter ATP-binding protein [Bacilli bacterium]